MLDGVSLDQLRTFIAAVDEGSFSAASRKLLRAQSVVSDTIRNLEEQIRVPRACNKLYADSLNVVVRIVERLDLEFASVAGAGINVANQQLPQRCAHPGDRATRDREDQAAVTAALSLTGGPG